MPSICMPHSCTSLKGSPFSGSFKVWDIRYTGVVQTFDAEPQAITQQQQNKGHVKLVNYTLDLKRGGIVCTTTHTDDNTSKLGRHEPAHTVAMDPTKTHSGAVAAACFDSTANTFLTASGCEVKVRPDLLQTQSTLFTMICGQVRAVTCDHPTKVGDLKFGDGHMGGSCRPGTAQW